MNENLVNLSNIILYGGRQLAFDDKNKKKKIGIYRESYLDENDVDKKGKPKLKFKYYYAKSKELVSKEDLERIHKLGLAPAYTDVWISEDPNSKIQATGMDAKGRKQYRYHPSHIEMANEDKFIRLYNFIKAIPKLDEKIEEDLKQTLYSKNRTIALMLIVIKELNIRVGKQCYVKSNKSYGITSLKKSHASVTSDGTVIKLSFKAKSNKQVSYTIKDKFIVDEMKKLLDMTDGENIFQYINENNNVLRVNDVDLNEYIQNNMGKNFSAKDFRTYAANFYFMKALLHETKKRNPKNKKIIKQNLNAAQENTAFYLRHTKAISKKSYTMSLIREMYEKNPEWFIENKSRQPINVLIDILKIYKDKIKEKRNQTNKDEPYNSNIASDEDLSDDEIADSDSDSDSDD
jgi:DNA topoisomerase-1